MYAEKKERKLDQISVEVDHTKVHAFDCAECIEKNRSRPRIDRFERRIRIRGGVDDGMAADLLRIADLCPVHRTLEASSLIITQIVDPR
jgi:uncharacterized OsmC-like protein